MNHSTNLGASTPLLEGGKSLRIPIKRTFSGKPESASHLERWESSAMTANEKIAALEQELGQLRSALAETARIHQQLGGESRMFESAVLALIISHPRPDLLAPVLDAQLSRVEAGVVALSNTDEQLQGVQDAQKLLMLALSEAVSRFRRQHGV